MTRDRLMETAGELASWITKAPLFIKGYEIGRKPNGDFVVRNDNKGIYTSYKDGYVSAFNLAGWMLHRVTVEEVDRAILRAQEMYFMHVPEYNRTMQIRPFPYSPPLEVQAERMRDTFEAIRAEHEKARLEREKIAADKAREIEAAEFVKNNPPPG